MLEKDAEIQLTIEKLTPGGRGLGRTDAFVVFVENALPGQTVRARVTKAKKRYAEATLLSVLEHGPHEVVPKCEHFGTCGGCAWQHLDYKQQLFWKREFVVESLERLAGAEHVDVAQTLPSPQKYEYRNKMEFAFAGGVHSDEPDSPLSLGLRKRASNDVVDVENCRLISKEMMAVVLETRKWCAMSGVPAYAPKSREGFWRHFTLRVADEKFMAHFITADMPEHARSVEAVAEHLQSMFPELVSVTHSTRRNAAQLAFGERVVRTYGWPRLHFKLNRTRYAVSADGFFQTNTEAAEKLYEVVRSMARPGPDDVVWDLYCGVGGIGLFTAYKAGSVVGFDVSRVAIEDAKLNAKRNGLKNCRFRAGDMRKILRGEKIQPSIVFTDPPRGGMHSDVVKILLKHKPRAIVSIACDPATQARDLAMLLQAYEIQAVQPVDLFPHTAHVENVVFLKRK